ncbi:hypothetical protein DFP92_108183 [Yoonia sediminilitoris]|uniref:Uncharacterized protein n=1 Tax=Yoonia sediminilitoris TaxID=1286148 RepID=A0A2T6KE04_9RHOB|nr:hypothetical protein C8N45_108182 [Yoonia sediminilitoris]RCW94595.1 hypothetical protein DFP92_108183 [Yoonia sediminilitoris]
MPHAESADFLLLLSHLWTGMTAQAQLLRL